MKTKSGATTFAGMASAGDTNNQHGAIKHSYLLSLTFPRVNYA
jgi:hypothetical protein